jgi:hypothetical protein
LPHRTNQPRDFYFGRDSWSPSLLPRAKFFFTKQHKILGWFMSRNALCVITTWAACFSSNRHELPRKAIFLNKNYYYYSVLWRTWLCKRQFTWRRSMATKLEESRTLLARIAFLWSSFLLLQLSLPNVARLTLRSFSADESED